MQSTSYERHPSQLGSPATSSDEGQPLPGSPTPTDESQQQPSGPPADEGSQSPPSSPSPADEVSQPPSASPGTSYEHQSLRPVSRRTTPEIQEGNLCKCGKNGDVAPGFLSSKRRKADPQPQIAQPQIDSKGPNTQWRSKRDRTYQENVISLENGLEIAWNYFFQFSPISFSFYSFLLLKFQDTVLKKVKKKGKKGQNKAIKLFKTDDVLLML